MFDGPRSAEPPRNHGMLCARIFRTLPEASRPARPFGSAGNTGKFRSRACGQLPLLHLANFSGKRGILRLICGKQIVPFFPRLPAAPADSRLEMVIDAVRNEEFRVLRPTIKFFRKANFFVTQGSPCASAVSCLCGEP